MIDIAGALGLNVLMLRKQKKLTQAELAKKVGVHVLSISRLERGAMQSVNIEMLGKVAKVLKVSPGSLWDGNR